MCKGTINGAVDGTHVRWVLFLSASMVTICMHSVRSARCLDRAPEVLRVRAGFRLPFIPVFVVIQS